MPSNGNVDVHNQKLSYPIENRMSVATVILSSS